MKKYLTLLAILWANDSFTQSISPILITTQSINIPGSLMVVSWMNDHPKQAYPDYPKLHYRFAEGDEVVIDFQTVNKKGTQGIAVTDYASNSVIYSNKQFQALEGLRIKVPKAGVYKFEFSTSHVLDRQANVVIKRIPASESTKDLNVHVAWKTVHDTAFATVEEKKKVGVVYEAVSLQNPIRQYVNSGSNAALLGGRSRVICPVTLPVNTVEWYYTFAASRNQNDMEATRSTMKLFSELTGVLDRTGLLSLTINSLTQPPGADYCSVYLLQPAHIQAFLDKEEPS